MAEGEYVLDQPGYESGAIRVCLVQQQIHSALSAAAAAAAAAAA